MTLHFWSKGTKFQLQETLNSGDLMCSMVRTIHNMYCIMEIC